MQILLIEDSVGDATLIKRAFAEIDGDVVVTWTPTAEAALRHIDSAGSSFDLALLDLNLPRMSGQEFLSSLLNFPIADHLPIIVVSSSSAPADIEHAYMARVAGYIVKPNDLAGYREIASYITACWDGLGRVVPGEKIDLRFAAGASQSAP